MIGHDTTEIAYRNGYAEGRRVCEAEIVQLSEKCQRLEKERDAAVADLKTVSEYFGDCVVCKLYQNGKCSSDEYRIMCSKNNSKWEWRGIDE